MRFIGRAGRDGHAKLRQHPIKRVSIGILQEIPETLALIDFTKLH